MPDDYVIKPRKASDLYPILTFQLFDSGTVVITPSVQAHLDREGIDASVYVDRHLHGDWGDVSAKDAEMNLLAVLLAGRPFSSYLIAGKRVWVITELDCTFTTLMFPEEY